MSLLHRLQKTRLLTAFYSPKRPLQLVYFNLNQLVKCFCAICCYFVLAHVDLWLTFGIDAPNNETRLWLENLDTAVLNEVNNIK